MRSAALTAACIAALLAGPALAQDRSLFQDRTLHLTGVGQSADRALACAQARNSAQQQVAASSQQRNTHHYNYAYASSMSDCTCNEVAGGEKWEYCITATAPDCVNNQRKVRTASSWSCSATARLDIRVTPTK